MSNPVTVLRLTDVVKTFPGVTALRGVSFDIRTSEVHALVGENGAGKSTLMAVAAGSTLPDSGSVEIGGTAMTNPSPGRAQELGLGVVYQHLSVLEDLTVVENAVLAMPASRRPPAWRWTSWARDRLETIGAAIDPAARVLEDFSLAERQLLEIAKALALEAKVLILDEPTESLTREETDRLFARIRDISARGTAVVYISPAPTPCPSDSSGVLQMRAVSSRTNCGGAPMAELSSAIRYWHLLRQHGLTCCTWKTATDSSCAPMTMRATRARRSTVRRSRRP